MHSLDKKTSTQFTNYAIPMDGTAGHSFFSSDPLNSILNTIFFLWAEGIQSSKITGINAGHPFSGYSQQVKAVCVQHNGCNVLGVNRIKSVTEHPRGAKGIFNGL